VEQYDLYPVLLLAGFLGSLVFIAAQDGPPKAVWAVISPIVAGTIMANYLPFFAVNYFFGEKAATGAGAAAGSCLIGLGGPYAAKAIIGRWQAWKPANGNGSSK
jgi:hypothetical protein